MSEHENRQIELSELPPSRNWMKRMRHWRRDFQWRTRLSQPESVPEGRPDPRCSDFAIVAIAVSAKYADWCLTMIDSARGPGDYQGPIYVVTDLPEQFEGLDNVFPIVVPATRVRLLVKSLKPMAFEWLSQKYVAYIDADVVVAASLIDWYRRCLRRLAEVSSPLLAYEVSNPVAQSFHGGLLFAEREAALPFLRQWLSMLRSGRYLSDQAALRRIATRTVPAYYSDADFCYTYQHLENSLTEVPTFVHLTNRVIQEVPRDELERYLQDRLNVTRLPNSFG